MTKSWNRGVAGISLWVLLSIALPAAGQQTGPVSGQKQQGPLVVERVKSGFVVATDFKVTELDDEVGALGGGYAGWITDQRLLVGGAGYWLINRSNDFKMAYGGLIVQWLARRDRLFGFGARGVIGVGEATLSSNLEEVFGRPGDPNHAAVFARFGERSRRPDSLSIGERRVIFSEGFFIFEPQIDVLLKLTDRIHLTGGVGYRVIGAARGLEDRLRGATGSVAVQFGGGS